MMKISPTTLKRWIKDERVRSQKIEGCRFVDISEYVRPGQGQLQSGTGISVSGSPGIDLTPLLKAIATQTREDKGS